MTKTAFISILGRPNVGKSTLLNTLLGEKVAIVSKKPQTTRNRITGILTKGETQYVFIDTPGIHKPHNLLGDFMMKVTGNASADADVILFLVEAGVPLNKAETEALKKASECENVILIINKTDVADKAVLAQTISRLASEYDFKAVIPVSALTGDNVEIIFDEIEPFLVESPHFFPDDISTDQPERQIFSELIREKLLRLLDDEIPHGIAVVVEDFKEKNDLISVRAEIYCEKEAHKKIIIGKNGSMLKKVGTYAREDAEKMFGVHVYLDLWVKVKENWRDRQALINNFGFKDE